MDLVVIGLIKNIKRDGLEDQSRWKVISGCEKVGYIGDDDSMSNLIKIEINDQMEQTVRSRELHEKLGIKKDFTDWFKQQTERLGLIEGRDFTPFWGESTGGRPSMDFKVSVDIAKHLCMISGGDLAYQIRSYFIQVEKAWNSPEQVMARAIQIADKRINNLQLIIEEQRPKVIFAEALEVAYNTILIGELAKILRQNGISIGQNRLLGKGQIYFVNKFKN